MTERKTVVHISASSQSSIAAQKKIVLADGSLCSRLCRSRVAAKYLILCFAKFFWNLVNFREIQNNFVKILCFTKFVQCCFAATLCRSGGGGGGGLGGAASTALHTLSR